MFSRKVSLNLSYGVNFCIFFKLLRINTPVLGSVCTNPNIAPSTLMTNMSHEPFKKEAWYASLSYVLIFLSSVKKIVKH